MADPGCLIPGFTAILGLGVSSGELLNTLGVGMRVFLRGGVWEGDACEGIALRGLFLLWTEEAARVTLRSSSILGSVSLVLRDVARRDTPCGERRVRGGGTGGPAPPAKKNK